MCVCVYVTNPHPSPNNALMIVVTERVGGVQGGGVGERRRGVGDNCGIKDGRASYWHALFFPLQRRQQQQTGAVIFARSRIIGPPPLSPPNDRPILEPHCLTSNRPRETE